MHLKTKLRTFFHPERFQGWGKERQYFEGWYYKIVSNDRLHAFAIIPGIAFDPKGAGHAFVQILDGTERTSVYHKFATSAFRASPDKLFVTVDSNTFTEEGLHLRLPGFQCDLTFQGNVRWPKPFYSPGIMGPYAFAPFMECYHGIVSMDHSIRGTLTTQGQEIDFADGRGYIEKDWGRSFPSAYVWMQSNHFGEPGISLKASVAMIPWLTGAFVGFIAGLWLRDRLIRFTTYNRSALLEHTVTREKVHLVLQNPDYRLEVNGDRDHSTELASPIHGAMDGKIEETMGAELNIKLTERRSGRLIYEGVGRSAGLEVAGNINDIVTS